MKPLSPSEVKVIHTSQFGENSLQNLLCFISAISQDDLNFGSKTTDAFLLFSLHVGIYVYECDNPV
jgi:hypothetical protein